MLLIGKGPSGQDISLELARAGASQVIVSFREFDDEPVSKLDKRTLKPPIDCIAQDGSVVFADGSTLEAPDVIMFCTGYLYAVADFLPSNILYPSVSPDETDGGETIQELKRATEAGHVIAPLYKQVLAIEEPDVAFIGLPFKNLPFRCFELQSKWLAQVFAGNQALPSKQQMHDEFFKYVNELPFPVRKLHLLGAERQNQYFRYVTLLNVVYGMHLTMSLVKCSELAGSSATKLDKSVQAMFQDAGYLRANFPLEYRSAEYSKDPMTGKWTRTLKHQNGGSEELLVETFA